jgi:hypothetical protein
MVGTLENSKAGGRPREGQHSDGAHGEYDSEGLFLMR